MKRRDFIQRSALSGASFALAPWLLQSCATNTSQTGTKASSDEMSMAGNMFFKISLAEWSLHRNLFAKKITNLDFPGIAKNEFGIDAVEYVNQFFKDKAQDQAYLQELKTRCNDLDVTNVLIMIDGEGPLGSTDAPERQKAVENHYKWVEAAQFLGCHSIRVNAQGQGTEAEVSEAAIQGLGSLATFAKDYNINVIVENHGGYSSNGAWMSNVIKSVDMENCGMLPDFGNFMIDRDKGIAYDRYKGMEELMPYAKGVSAKSNVFNEQGEEVNIDYARILKIVKDAGYTGYIGVEYEGEEDEYEGIRATKALLEKIGTAMG